MLYNNFSLREGHCKSESMDETLLSNKSSLNLPSGQHTIAPFQYCVCFSVNGGPRLLLHTLKEVSLGFCRLNFLVSEEHYT